MYNFKSDMSHKDPQYVVEVKNRNPYRTDPWITWNIPFWKFKESERWNGQRRLLTKIDSPTISACTTATNLSSLDLPHHPLGSATLHNSRRMVTVDENLRVAQPEIQPLQNKEKLIENDEARIGSINDDVSVCSNNIYKETTVKKPTIIRQVITALSVSLVSLIVGFVSAYTSPAEETLRSEVGISKEQYSWVCGLMPLGALIGGLVGGQLIELAGRKITISATNLLFVLSWAMVALATNVWYLYAARSISGFCVGIASLALPVYLGETVQPEVRGTLGLLPTAFGNIGILMCFAIGSYLKWNQLAWVGICLPVPFLFLMFIIPETPRWYVAKGKHEQARNALQWLRGKDANIKAEYDELETSQKESDESSSSSNLGELFNRVHLKPLLISLGLMFFQQMSGINAVIFYTTSIFEMAGSTINKNLCTIIVGIVNFISTFIATVLIDRLGRKVLLYVSSVSMTLTLACLGTYFHLSRNGYDVSNYGWLPLVSFVVYVLGFSLGFGPIPWLMLGEILPAKIRGSAAALATAFNWTCTFIVTKTFVDIISLIGPDGTFWLFAAICVVSLVFVIMWVPETQGQSLQDIERKLAGLKVRRMSSKANMKPLPSTF